MSKGDRTMLRTVAASSGCTTAGSSNSRLNNSVNSANPNSPPWPTTTPVRRDLNQLEVAGFAATVTTATLSSSIPTRVAATNGKCRTSNRTSSSMPTVMKNRPSKISRYERIVASIW